MAMAAVSNGRSHLRDASFSSYLDTADTDFVRSLAASMHGGSSPVFTPSRQSPSPMSKQRSRGAVGELGVFGAESYFSEKVDHHHHHHERTPSFRSVEDGVSKPTTLKSKSRTPSMRSECSWTSKSSRSMDQLKPKKSLGGPWFLAGLQCKGSCYDVKPPVYTKQASSTATNQRKGFWEDQVVQINLKKKQPCHQIKASETTTMLPSSFAFPNTRGEDPRKSIEVFGLHRYKADQKEDDMSFIMEKKLSMLSWDAIPIQSQHKGRRSSGRYDDMDSDASSDLFDIPVFPAEMTTPAVTAPSEASIEWSVVTASAAGFSAVSDLEEERQFGAKKKTTTTLKPRPRELQTSVANGGILGCRSDKAVKVVTPTARIAGPVLNDCQVFSPANNTCFASKAATTTPTSSSPRPLYMY